ncbi:outer membrane protein transport protein [Methylobacillus gramineus]|uniref:OmpP1/FadL family transporter n=1 Tax=Methylobacillus gramineus TaxID=755169 RepID=UPI001CFFA919|nr:outer membrane protein transport protein [Methylobacillus gramineus]MCB5185786.1 outer membrane protein transport protein [Methylobacillus gramineus]
MSNRAVWVFLMGMTAAPAYAAGFALIEQSASGLGNSYAGMAARSDDASTQFFNPANLSFLPQGRQVVFGLSAILPSAKMDDPTGDVRFNNTQSPVTGNNGGNVASLAMVPNFYFADDINDTLKYGVGITVPYGLSSEFKDGWVGRYSALKSELETLNINPVISWKASERLSIAGGINLQYVKATLTNAIDSSSLCLANQAPTGAIPAGSCNAVGLGQPGNAAADSYAKLSGDDLSWGFNLGVVFKPVAGTTIGAAYRSHIKHQLSGDASFRRSAQINRIAPLASRLSDGDIQAKLSLPETVSLSLAQQLNDKFELLADVTWTNWSRFKELRIQFDSGDDNVTTTKWNNSYRFSLGGNYRYSEAVTLRMGVAYDQTAVPDAEHRTPRIPDADRTWVSLGARWKMDAINTFDIGYAYLFMKEAKLNHSTEGASVQHRVQGEFSPNVNLLSVQWTRVF